MIRVAVVGVNGTRAARRVVRLLLADGLDLDGERGWERRLLDDGGGVSGVGRGGLLIRYGETVSSSLTGGTGRTTVPVMQVPAEILRRNNIEILISEIGTTSSEEGDRRGAVVPVETFLSPTVGTPVDGNGRHITLSQPVHSCLVVADGLDELVSVSELLSRSNASPADRELIRLCVELGDVTTQSPDGGSVITFDGTKAEGALKMVRESLSKAAEYTSQWNESGLPLLTKWLGLSFSSGSGGSLAGPVRRLITSVLDSASTTLQLESERASAISTTRLLGRSSVIRATLDDAVSAFSRNAHQELQSGLTSAWKSRNWRKLAWYKLFWRVDDVGLIISDLVSNAWLPRTERSMYELSGRFTQAGISPIEIETPVLATEVVPEAIASEVHPVLLATATLASTADIKTEPVLVNRDGHVRVSMTPSPQPVPVASTISRSRHGYLNHSIADLTSTAQQLVFRTLSITGLSAGLSGLTYYSLAAGSLYEAGTIFAVGTAYALWRMQSDWQRSCKLFEDGLMETGRTTIRQLEQKLRKLISDSEGVTEGDFEEQSRKAAAEAVAHAKKALQSLR